MFHSSDLITFKSAPMPAATSTNTGETAPNRNMDIRFENAHSRRKSRERVLMSSRMLHSNGGASGSLILVAGFDSLV